MSEIIKKWAFRAGIVVITLLNACTNPPEFSVIPKIEFVSAEFWNMGEQNQDSLNITIFFQDGDSNLGLDENNFFLPRKPYIVYLFDEQGRFTDEKNFYVSGNGELITLAMRNTPPYDTLPPYTDPYDCINYLYDTTLFYDGVAPWEYPPSLTRLTRVTDTLYFQRNPDHFNIFVDFLIKQQDGSFERFPWESFLGYPSCGESFNARFTRSDVGISEGDNGPIEGRLTYKMASFAFIFELRNKTFKLRVRIVDRHGNSSNTTESDEFTLEKIQVN